MHVGVHVREGRGASESAESAERADLASLDPDLGHPCGVGPVADRAVQCWPHHDHKLRAGGPRKRGVCALDALRGVERA